MGKVKLEGYVCERCGHKWIPRETTIEEPKVCPKCKSPYWNTPRKNEIVKTGYLLSPRGDKLNVLCL